MTANNDFIPFAINIASNVLSQSDYEAADTGGGFVQLGFEAGIAQSAQLNKVWRQSSVMSSGLGQLMANAGFDALDNGDITSLVVNMQNAFLAITRQNPTYSEDSGAVNVVTAILTPVPSAFGQDFTIDVRVAHTNTGASTLTVNGQPPVSITRGGSALLGGEMLAGQIATFKRDITSNAYQLVSAVASQNSIFSGTGPTTGTANAQILAAVSPSGFALAYGDIVNFTAGVTNTGAASINVASSGAITMKKVVSAALVDLAAGDITSGSSYSVNYNGTFWVLINASFNPANFLAVANNLSDLSNPGTARTNLGLGSVAVLNVSTDGTLAANSDTLSPSQKAVKTYVDNKFAAVPFTGKFTSANQSVATRGQTTAVAHGLGAIPFGFSVVMRCITNSNGFAVGQEIPVNYGVGFLLDGGGNVTDLGSFEAAADATNVYWVNNSPIITASGTTGFVLSNFNLILRAWL